MATRNNIFKSLLLTAALVVISLTLGLYAQSSTTAKRCEATTKKGTRCKNTAVNNTKYCQEHQAKFPTVQQCKVKTKSDYRRDRQSPRQTLRFHRKRIKFYH